MVYSISLQAAALALPALSMAAAFPKAAGLDTRIVGGRPAIANEYPSIVSLSVNGEASCGGALVNEWTVLTAAHCIKNLDKETGVVSESKAEEFQVRAGSLNSPRGGIQVSVDSVLVHPDYNMTNMANDIAVLELNYPIHESDSVSFGSLTSDVNIPADGSNLHLAGWGLTSEGGNASTILLTTTVHTTTNSKCEPKLEGNKLTDSMFCGGDDDGGIDSCQGDSGGPIYNDNGDIVGVVSWGVGCARPNSPGIYSRVGYFLDWIHEVTWSSVSVKVQGIENIQL